MAEVVHGSEASRSPIVSVGMPVFNGLPYVEEAVRSLLGQSWADFELVISDNASTDGTVEFLERVAQQDSRIRLHRNDQNLGAVANFNRVLSLANGQYFMWAGADDVWEPTYIESVLQALRSSPRAVLSFSALDWIGPNRDRVRDYPELHSLSHYDRLERLRRFILMPEEEGKANLIYGLAHKSTFDRVNGLRDWGTSVGADMHFVFNMLSQGDVAFVPDLLFHKRATLPIRFQSQSYSTNFRRFLDGVTDWLWFIRGYVGVISENSFGREEQASLFIALATRTSRYYANYARKKARALRDFVISKSASSSGTAVDDSH